LKLLLDTHAFLWFVLDDPKLSATARQVIESGANETCISLASFWEIAIKVSLGRYRLNAAFEAFWTAAIQQNDVTVLPVEVGHVAPLVSMPFHHKDPFDRLLIAQAMAEQIPLVSVDPRLDAYGVSRLW
jgi:PIN domain nuclease of toxin-antitoxin system